MRILRLSVERVSIEENVVDNDRTDGAGVTTKKFTYFHDLLVKESL